MHRRSFLRNTLLAAGAMTLYPACRQGSHKRKFGIILSTLKNEVLANPAGVMHQLAEAGYTYIEGLGRYGIPEEPLAAAMREAKLIPVATGESMPQWLQDPDRYIALATTYRMPYLVCYWPWTGDIERLSMEQVLQAAENLEQIGKLCHQHNLRFAWHNHDREFTALEENGRTPFDIIMEHTTSAYVKAELDVYWVAYAGKSPLDIMRQYQGRIGILHLKDMLDGTRERACPGEGMLDFASILALQEETKVDYLIVENEKNEKGVPCATSALHYLQQL